MSKGKFANEQDEVLYGLATDDGEWVGSDEFGVSAALVIVDAAESSRLGIAAGNFVVTETDQGFVSVDCYDTSTDAWAALMDVREAYDKFMEA